jgi:hypothetical protein
MWIRKVACRVVNGPGHERQGSAVTLDPSRRWASLLANPYHRAEAVYSDQMCAGEFHLIGSKLLPCPAADVNYADSHSARRAWLFKEGQQVRVNGVIPAWLVVQTGDVVVINPGHRQ